jgi:hypothetical protein
LLLFNTQARIRLFKWYKSLTESCRKRQTKEIVTTVLTRRLPASNFIEWKGEKIIYQRYANLFFTIVIEQDDNELLALEIIQRFVEILDYYFGSVCELDIIFNFEKTHFIWNELVLGGEVVDIDKTAVLEAVLDQDDIQKVFTLNIVLNFNSHFIYFHFCHSE